MLLTAKELGHELRRNARYVYAMVARGFPMPGGTASLAEARAWLEKNPCPRRRRYVPHPPITCLPARKVGQASCLWGKRGKGAEGKAA